MTIEMETEMTMKMRMLALAVIVFGAAACSGDAQGTVKVTIWGEEAGTKGYPGSGLVFVDGWNVSYTHWITSFGDIELADAKSEAVIFGDATVYLGDWAKAPAPTPVTTTDLPQGRYKVSYSFLPAVAGAAEVNDVDDALASQMVQRGWNTYIEGSATNAEQTVTFKWGMHNPTRYKYCENGIDDTDGIAVTAGKDVEAGLFVHLDHLFWDRLATEEAALRFDVLAGWKDPSGAIPFDDLENVAVANITDRAGAAIFDENGQQLRYNDAGLGYPKLREFMVFSASTQGHLNGEGLCTLVKL